MTGSLVWPRGLGPLVLPLQTLNRVAVPTRLPYTWNEAYLQRPGLRPRCLRVLFALRRRFPLLAGGVHVGPSTGRRLS